MPLAPGLAVAASAVLVLVLGLVVPAINLVQGQAGRAGGSTPRRP